MSIKSGRKSKSNKERERKRRRRARSREMQKAFANEPAELTAPAPAANQIISTHLRKSSVGPSDRDEGFLEIVAHRTPRRDK
jgi:hypothetical protein